HRRDGAAEPGSDRVRDGDAADQSGAGSGTALRGAVARDLRHDRNRPDRSALEHEWRLWPGVRLELIDERCWAQGGHIEQATPVADILELKGEDRFVLHGRTADLVNIAGKRSSLAYLNHQLNAIPGVLDGAFFVREDAQACLAGIARLAALVVAPSLDVATILRRLRERIDPVF